MTNKCDVCFRNCTLTEGQTGVCLSRVGTKDGVVPENYGRLTSLALDPIEKKPLARFFPGSLILSVGSYGCNLKCPFCQNVEISLADGRENRLHTEYCAPEQLCSIAKSYEPQGNIGVAFTYNEPLTGYEYVLDTARLVHAAGMKNVLVTNGSVRPWVVDEIGPYIDAMNIDLKCFSTDYYRDILKGDLKATKAFIRQALLYSHVELTTLIIPEENDSDEEMRELSGWVHSLETEYQKKIPLHISRFFPRSVYSDRQPTRVATVFHLADIAREQLEFVYEGNC